MTTLLPTRKVSLLHSQNPTVQTFNSWPKAEPSTPFLRVIASIRVYAQENRISRLRPT